MKIDKFKLIGLTLLCLGVIVIIGDIIKENTKGLQGFIGGNMMGFGIILLSIYEEGE